MAENEPVRIISDNPEKKSVAFGFDAYAWTIADLIEGQGDVVQKKQLTCVGIFGKGCHPEASPYSDWPLTYIVL